MKQLLVEHGCARLRAGKGDHEIWQCPDQLRSIVVVARSCPATPRTPY
ncbi:hypothetical protein OKW76_14020 [Sphingomonas sp. S1-29]|nr:hypothetical protein [Sphingomonas sp. S1-29]UZK69127.1 hypothetical protein OKW76_14020 [Sphingomonas sp. S1-29]